MSTRSATSRRYAAMLGALGQEARLAIVRELLRAHGTGMVAGEIAEALQMPASTLSHHLDALHREGIVRQVREGKFLRYFVDADGMGRLLGFLVDECVTKSAVVPTAAVTQRLRRR